MTSSIGWHSDLIGLSVVKTQLNVTLMTQLNVTLMTQLNVTLMTQLNVTLMTQRNNCNCCCNGPGNATRQSKL